MDYESFILVDYENVQDINTDVITGKNKMLIIVGENQKKVPVSLIQQTQPFGDSIEWMQIRSYGKKNALDFFLVYFLGHYTTKYSGKEFIIYSKDTGYDPLIEYLKTKGCNVRRIVSFKQLGGGQPLSQPLNTPHSEDCAKVIENLKKVPTNKRPKSRKGLHSHIKAMLKKPDDEIEKILEEMFINKIIYEENGHLKYILK